MRQQIFAPGEERDNVDTKLMQSPYVYIEDKCNAFIANGDKLSISPKLAEVCYDKIEKIRSRG